MHLMERAESGREKLSKEDETNLFHRSVIAEEIIIT